MKRQQEARDTLPFASPSARPEPPQQQGREPEPQPKAPPPSDEVRSPCEAPFPYRDYLAAKAALEQAISQGPFYGLVTGPSGSGKTSLLSEVTRGLDRHRQQVLHVSSSLATVRGTARFLARALNVSLRSSHLETLTDISKVLTAQAAHLTLWIDDAEQIPVETLAELRLFAECALEVPQLMSVVLTGLPEFRSTLDQRALFSLKRRISLRVTLSGLRRDELDPFLAHRLGTLSERRIPAALRDELFERASGVPALIDRVGRLALAMSEGGEVTHENLRGAFDALSL